MSIMQRFTGIHPLNITILSRNSRIGLLEKDTNCLTNLTIQTQKGGHCKELTMPPLCLANKPQAVQNWVPSNPWQCICRGFICN
jgi:hypothetical protein